MAPLSDLSIGFIVGGSVIFASIILGFIVWKIVESKRRSKSNHSNPHTGQPRVETPPENVTVIAHQNNVDSRERSSQYSEIHVDSDYNRTTTQKSADSPTVERQGVPTQVNTDDSGYCEGQGSCGRSEVYARLHEARNHVEKNIYGGFVDEDSGQGSFMRMNSASANSDGDHEYDITVVTPASKTSSNQDDVEATTISETLAEDDEMYYDVAIQRVDIIEVHRPAVYGFEDEVGKIASTEREDQSDISGDSDEPSEQDTSL